MTTPMLSKVWTQRQGIQPWWSAHTQHLDLQVTTCEGLDPTWTVWDGHKRLAGGTAPDVLRIRVHGRVNSRHVPDDLESRVGLSQAKDRPTLCDVEQSHF